MIYHNTLEPIFKRYDSVFTMCVCLQTRMSDQIRKDQNAKMKTLFPKVSILQIFRADFWALTSIHALRRTIAINNQYCQVKTKGKPIKILKTLRYASGRSRVWNTRAKPGLQVWERGSTSKKFLTDLLEARKHENALFNIYHSINSGLQRWRSIHNKGRQFAQWHIWIQSHDAILRERIWFHRSCSFFLEKKLAWK